MSINYYAKAQVVSGVAVGILTGGLSTVVGGVAFASHLLDAKNFVISLWNAMDSVANERGSVVSQVVL